MSGRTRGWKGALAVHSWIVIKRENDAQLEPLRRGRLGQSGAAELVAAGPVVRRARRRCWSTSRARRPQALIPRIEAAIKSYQYANAGDYRIWPGPNSNTFVATVLRAVPELGVTMPPNAVGRDFRPLPYAGLTDSGTGVEASLWGLLGVKLGWVEGIEVNVLGLVAGLDLRHPAREGAGLRPHRRRWRGRDGGGGEISVIAEVVRASTETVTRSAQSGWPPVRHGFRAAA